MKETTRALIESMIADIQRLQDYEIKTLKDAIQKEITNKRGLLTYAKTIQDICPLYLDTLFTADNTIDFILNKCPSLFYWQIIRGVLSDQLNRVQALSPAKQIPINSEAKEAVNDVLKVVALSRNFRQIPQAPHIEDAAAGGPVIAEDSTVNIMAPEWVAEGLIHLSHQLQAIYPNGIHVLLEDLEGNTDIHVLQYPLTLHSLQLLAKNRCYHTAPGNNIDFYGKLAPAFIDQFKWLSAQCIITGSTTAIRYPNPEKRSQHKTPYLELNTPVHIISATALDFESYQSIGTQLLVQGDGVGPVNPLNHNMFQALGLEAWEHRSTEHCETNPERYKKFKDGQYLDKLASEAFFEQSLRLSIRAQIDTANRNRQFINCKFLKYDAQYFGPDLDTLAAPIEESMLNALHKVLDEIFSEGPREEFSCIKGIELPSFAKNNVKAIQALCEQYQIKFSHAKSDPLCPTPHLSTTVTHYSSPHAPFGSKTDIHNTVGWTASADETLAENLANKGLDFCPYSNPNMIHRLENPAKLSFKSPKPQQPMPLEEPVNQIDIAAAAEIPLSAEATQQIERFKRVYNALYKTQYPARSCGLLRGPANFAESIYIIDRTAEAQIERALAMREDPLVAKAWLLSEIRNNVELFKQTYKQAVSKSGFFSQSKVTGEWCFFKKSVFKALDKIENQETIKQNIHNAQTKIGRQGEHKDSRTEAVVRSLFA